ncbi:MAG TPA: ABC transporter permease [Baekduia sp.]|nr:ABC transporter permease [Baekduia sp.]
MESRRAAGHVPEASEAPPWLWIDRLGGMTALALRSAAELVSPGGSWLRQMAIQAAGIFQRVVLTLILVDLAFGFSATGISVGGVLSSIGAIDRAAATVPVAFLRELGVLVTAAVAAGAIGTMITAELVALMLGMPVLTVIGFVVGCFGAYLGIVGFYDASHESFISQFLSNTSWLDLWSSQLKAVIYGLIIGVIASYKGLSVKGGPEGVGRAVNECVVACIVGCAAIGVLYSAIFLAINPDIAVQR